MGGGIRFTEEQFAAAQARSGRRAPAASAPAPVVSPPKGKAGKKSGPNRLEVAMLAEIRRVGLPLPCAQYKHIEGREFLLDFAYPEIRLGIECQGKVHTVKDKHARDIEKRALGQLNGWVVLEVDSVSVASGIAVAWLKTLMGMLGRENPEFWRNFKGSDAP